MNASINVQNDGEDVNVTTLNSNCKLDSYYNDNNWDEKLELRECKDHEQNGKYRVFSRCNIGSNQVIGHIVPLVVKDIECGENLVSIIDQDLTGVGSRRRESEKSVNISYDNDSYATVRLLANLLHSSEHLSLAQVEHSILHNFYSLKSQTAQTACGNSQRAVVDDSGLLGMLIYEPHLLMAIETFANKCVENKIINVNQENISSDDNNSNNNNNNNNDNSVEIKYQLKKGFDNSLSFGNLICGFIKSSYLKCKTNVNVFNVSINGKPVIFYLTRKHIKPNEEMVWEISNNLHHWPTADTWYYRNTKNGVF